MNSKILIALFSVVAVSACVAEDPGSMFVQGSQRITRQQQCAPQAAGGGSQQVFVTMGTLDLLQTNRYIAHLVVGSRLPNINSATGKEAADLQIEVNEITITGAWVTYRVEDDSLKGPYFGNTPVDLDGDGEEDLPANLRLPESVFVPTSGFLPNANNAVVSLEVIPPPVGLALDVDMAFDKLYSAGIISAEIVMEGYMTDGTEVHSTPFTFPIKVCRGCLVAYNMDPPECCTFLTQPTYVPCFPGQDESSPCTVACDVLRNVVREDQKRAMLLGEIDSLATVLPAVE